MTDITVQVADRTISVEVGGPGTAGLAASVIEMQAAPPHSPGPAGAILTNDSGESDASDSAWLARADIGEQPIYPVPITTPAKIQLAKTSTAGSFTATPTGGKLRFQPTATGSTQGFRVGGTTTQVSVGDIIRTTFELVAEPDGISWGFVFAIFQTAPTPGGPMISLPADTPVISMRGDNGAIGLLNPAQSTYPGSSGSSPGSGTTWAEGQVIEGVYEVLSETSARATVRIDGSNEFSRTFTAFPATGYFATGVYLVDTDDQADVDIPQIRHASPPLPRYLHLLGDAPNGEGTDRNPFGTLAEAVADYRYDPTRRYLDLTFKGGVLAQSVYPGTLPFDLSGLRELTLRPTVGTRPKIDMTVAIAPTFTLVGGEVYRFPTPAFDANLTFGGLVCVTEGVTQSFGFNDFYTAQGFRFPSRLGTNIAFDDASFVRGRLSVHISGTHAGYTLVRLHDGSDPNEHDWRWSSYSAGIYLPATDQDGWNARRVNVENIDLYGGFAYAFYADRWTLDMTSVRAYATVNGYPFEMNHCGGVVRDLFAEGFGADAFHTGDVGTKPLEGADPTLYLYDCIARGGAALYGADGFSNHGRAKWKIIRGEATGCGKSGIATAGDIQAEGVLLQGCPEAGFTLANTAANVTDNGPDRTASLKGATLRANAKGALVNMTAGTTDASLRLDLDDILYIDNVTASNHIRNDGTDCTAEIHYDPDRMRFVTTGGDPSDDPTEGDYFNELGTYVPLNTRAPV